MQTSLTCLNALPNCCRIVYQPDWRGGGCLTRLVMAHEIAKLVLEHAETFVERSEAIKTALSMGMPLSEIEEYLDWLAVIRAQKPVEPKGKKSPPQNLADS